VPAVNSQKRDKGGFIHFGGAERNTLCEKGSLKRRGAKNTMAL